MKALLAILKNTVKGFMNNPLFALSAATDLLRRFFDCTLAGPGVGLAALVFGEDSVLREVGRQLESFVGAKPPT